MSHLRDVRGECNWNFLFSLYWYKLMKDIIRQISFLLSIKVLGFSLVLPDIGGLDTITVLSISSFPAVRMAMLKYL